MIYRKNLCIIHSIIGMLCLGVSTVYSQINADLDCFAIPSYSEQLCIDKTDSAYGPFDDVIIYRKEQNGELILLEDYSGGVGVFNGLVFSDNGHLMSISWAEEGHPYFLFYETTRFMVQGGRASHIGTINDYRFAFLHQIGEDGLVVYAQTEGAYEHCPSQAGRSKSIRHPNTGKTHCLVYRQLAIDLVTDSK